MTEAQQKRRSKEIHAAYVGTFGTEAGKTCLGMLTSTFVDRSIYKQGQTYEETSYRQGQADVIKQIKREIGTW